MQIHVVYAGDSVDSIAREYGVDVNVIIYVNQLRYPYELTIGQALLILEVDEMRNGPELVTNGYAYPFIRQEILQETLPFLSELSVFSYGFTVNGELISPPLEEDWMILLASSARTEAILTLTPFGEDGQFNNNLIHQMLIQNGSSENLINHVFEKIQEKGYSGADIDFEYALTEIPREKITMGVPNYGYDWPLPYERGVTQARTIGCVEAVELAVRYQSEILYDELAKTPYFRYEENGISHEVWFEDVRSIQAKMNLVLEKELPGIGYWQVMRLFLAGLIYMDQVFSIDKSD